ncbi:hypothetical protein BDR04DRAFT_1121873 [Suillus decipiens]|nr:hypothetical protein BDR04DRAFT_1121873 [Suillus decipiens]
MRDEHVMLLEIIERDVPHAEFVFLSACHTAVGDEETPDEAIHLAAGLQFLGFKGVTGTLWEVNNAIAKHVVGAFYKYMFDPKYGVSFINSCNLRVYVLCARGTCQEREMPVESLGSKGLTPILSPDTGWKTPAVPDFYSGTNHCN